MKKIILSLAVAMFLVSGSLAMANSNSNDSEELKPNVNSTALTLPEGCRPGFYYSPTTGKPCGTKTNIPGCFAGAKYSVVTGQPCPDSTDKVPPNGRICADWKRNLRFGLRGDDVSELQQILKDKGFLLKSAPLGYFGPMTQAAVEKLQVQEDIEATSTTDSISSSSVLGASTMMNHENENDDDNRGHVGPRTRGFLKRICAWATGTTPPNPIITITSPVITSIAVKISNSTSTGARSSGPVGTTVVLTGSNFTPTGNKINFGNFDEYGLSNLSSTDGKTLEFNIPSSTDRACTHIGTPCMAIMDKMVTPGTYPISVKNSNGTSNTIYFTVTAS